MNVIKKIKVNNVSYDISSSSPITSSNVELQDDDSTADFNIGDVNGNVIAQFKDGHIKTKNFDSENIISTTTNNPLKNKTISIMGDSITTFSGYIPTGYATFYPSGEVNDVSYTWWKKLITECEMDLLINNSYSGSRISDGSSFSRSEIPFSDERRYSNLQNPDIILVFGGVNDCSSQGNPQPLGELNKTTSETFDRLYFKQAYQSLAKNLTTLYTSSKIFFMIPLLHNHINWKNTNSWGHIELRETIKEIADMYGITVIETYKCGMNYYNKSLYTLDGLHPNKAGHELVKNYVKNQLYLYFN